uniref:ATP synthase complex subunit 8 n=1 Tax=Tribolium confusum TaxID=7071 RepID=A0A0U1Z3B2_TRICF|nr:ATP synthase F0 subunit 8 [Tribolium confusum]AJP09525.1 ATP synthase F0 subunit 8 [Tribolium confusum]
MPQMAPLNWLLLMIIFIAILVTFNIMNYYTVTYQTLTKPSQNLKLEIKTNWKW